jgi:hypothetical protein
VAQKVAQKVAQPGEGGGPPILAGKTWTRWRGQIVFAIGPTAFTPVPVRRRVAGMKKVLLMITVVMDQSVLTADFGVLWLDFLGLRVYVSSWWKSVVADYFWWW